MYSNSWLARRGAWFRRFFFTVRFSGGSFRPRNGWSPWLQERTRVKQKQWTFQEIPRYIGSEKSIPVNLHKHIWIFTFHLWRRPVLTCEKRTLLKIDTSSQWNRYFSNIFKYFFLIFIDTFNWSEASEILWNIWGKILQVFLEIYIFWEIKTAYTAVFLSMAVREQRWKNSR